MRIPDRPRERRGSPPATVREESPKSQDGEAMDDRTATPT
jgi:hypothetical protein